MAKASVNLPPKLLPVFADNPGERVRYRGARGGRGSAKTFSFAKMSAIFALRYAKAGVSGIILCGREYQNSLDESSMAEVKTAIASEPWLAEQFDVGEKYIRTRAHLPGRVEYKFAGLRHNIDSIKSKSRILIIWVDEAEPVSEDAWVKIVPTVRAEGVQDFDISDPEAFFEWNSEIWVTWNPERRKSATNKRFWLDKSDGMKIINLNYKDNPWFPKTLEGERLADKERRPDKYDHIWEGDYATVIEGAYYAQGLLQAQKDNRIVVGLGYDPLLPVYSFDDIGGSGARADSYTKWIVQFIEDRILFLDYYESQGQVLSFHVDWMRKRGWSNAHVMLPHDGVNSEKVVGGRYEDHWRAAEFVVTVVPNMGKGAAMQRIEATRLLTAKMWFDKDKTDAGREAVACYHANKNNNRDVDLGPLHDWSSHAADAFGMVGIKYDDLRPSKLINRAAQIAAMRASMRSGRKATML